jgi:adenosylcobinamide kinase / adenosylcobinamide-phosphate guanylyltransferase
MVDREIILVTGATRSGKSEWAESLAQASQKPVIYVATSLIDKTDQEWCDRISQHQQRRSSQWQTLEIPVQLSQAIDNSLSPGCLLIDSLGTWVANCLEMSAENWQEMTEKLLQSLHNSSVDIILVSEETGWGVVPAYPLGRLFRDRLGDLSRKIGTMADTVYLVTGGHALNLSQLGQRLNPTPMLPQGRSN